MIKTGILVIFFLSGAVSLFAAPGAEEADGPPLDRLKILLLSREKAFKVSLDFKQLGAPALETDRSLSILTQVQSLVLSGAYNESGLAALEKIVQEKKVTVLVLSGTRQAAERNHFRHLSTNFGNIDGIRRYKQSNPIAGQEALALLRSVVNCLPFLKPSVDSIKKQVRPLVVLGPDFGEDWAEHRLCFEAKKEPCLKDVCRYMWGVYTTAHQHSVTIQWDKD